MNARNGPFLKTGASSVHNCKACHNAACMPRPRPTCRGAAHNSNLDELSRQFRSDRNDQLSSSHCASVLSLRQSRWPVSGFVDALHISNANAWQNPRTRLNTIKPRRLTKTGTISSARRLRLPIFTCNRGNWLLTLHVRDNRIKKPKTFRYPSLKGTDPKFRRNHKHALHGTMKALKEVKEGKREAA